MVQVWPMEWPRGFTALAGVNGVGPAWQRPGSFYDILDLNRFGQELKWVGWRLDRNPAKQVTMRIRTKPRTGPRGNPVRPRALRAQDEQACIYCGGTQTRRQRAPPPGVPHAVAMSAFRHRKFRAILGHHSLYNLRLALDTNSR